MPFTVYDRLVKALQLDSFGTLGIEVIFSALTPLGFTTASAIQAVTGFVVGSPVVGYSTVRLAIRYITASVKGLCPLLRSTSARVAIIVWSMSSLS
jgi:hypothetical protein